MAGSMTGIVQRFQQLLLDTRQEQVAELDRLVEERMAAQILDEADECYGGWGEVRRAEDAELSFGGNALYRLAPLAQAWGNPASRYYQDAELARRLTLAWRLYHRFIYPGCPFPNNWWAWQVGIPECLGDILLVAGDAFPAEDRQSLVASLRHLVDHVWTFHPGANGMWAAMVYLRYGLASGDESYLERAAATVNRVCEITDYQGILPDYSYSFHGRGLNMGYGTLHFEYIGRFTFLMGDSPWRMCDRTLANAANLLLDFVQWTLVGNTIDPFILDRGISMNEEAFNASALINGALFLTTGPIPRREEARACCRRLIDEGLPPTNPVAEKIAAELLTQPQPPLYGMRYWPESEYFVARQPGWTASVRMASEKNKCYFGINNTNLKGWHISDGQLILRFSAEEYRHGVLPTMDWERLTGITCAKSFKIPEETHGHSWFAAGGTNKDGTLGCCGIDFMVRTLERNMLTARKSWFFLGDAIVALATGITCSGDDEVETIIRHAPLRCDARVEESEQDLAVEMLEGGGGAYILPEKPHIRIRTEIRTGRWSDLREGGEITPLLTRAYWTAVIPHGRRPDNDQYIIVYLPGKTAKHAAAWWAERPFEIIQQDNLSHRVRDNRTGAVLVVEQWVGARVEDRITDACRG
ncbi:MAG: polysaccharide lyase family 8 super-sandwich domain-containing protein [Armatimonadota bacterium]